MDVIDVLQVKPRFQQAYAYLLSRGYISSKTDLALKIGASRPAVSNAYKGQPEYLTPGIIDKLCAAFPFISREWLISGTGDMLTANQPAGATNGDGAGNSATDMLNALLEAARSSQGMSQQTVALVSSLQAQNDALIRQNERLINLLADQQARTNELIAELRADRRRYYPGMAAEPSAPHPYEKTTT